MKLDKSKPTGVAQSNKNQTKINLTYFAYSGRYPHGTTVQDLAKAKQSFDLTGLHLAAIFGHLIAGTTTSDLRGERDQMGRTAFDWVVAMTTPAIPCTRLPRKYARIAARNILACPELGALLTPKQVPFHRSILCAVKRDPRFTSKIRAQLAKHPALRVALA